MVELESGGRMSRDEVAAFLREFVEELEEGSTNVTTTAEPDDRRTDAAGSQRTDATGGGRRREDAGRNDPDDRTIEERERTVPSDASRITFVVGGESATVTVPETLEFDVEVESRSPLLKSGVNQEVEFHLSWEIEDQPGDDSIDLK